MAFLSPEYCRLFAQKKAYLGGGGGGGVTGTPRPPSYSPVEKLNLLAHNGHKCSLRTTDVFPVASLPTKNNVCEEREATNGNTSAVRRLPQMQPIRYVMPQDRAVIWSNNIGSESYVSRPMFYQEPMSS